MTETSGFDVVSACSCISLRALMLPVGEVPMHRFFLGKSFLDSFLHDVVWNNRLSMGEK